MNDNLDQMEKIKTIRENHRLSFSIDLIPYKYLSQTIRDFSQHIKDIDSIVSEDSDVLKLCEIFKSEISANIKYLQDKLNAIPNPKYLDESDEEFVDKYM